MHGLQSSFIEDGNGLGLGLLICTGPGVTETVVRELETGNGVPELVDEELGMVIGVMELIEEELGI